MGKKQIQAERVKTVLALFDKKDKVMKRDMVDALGIPSENVWHLANTLVKKGLIKIVSYNVDSGHRLAVYGRVKDE